ncbi:MAG: YjbQ family protein [Methanobacteriota archaeon]|nr:MAG: YjbQ family protein [Euryarchaeota archaeon]
MEVITREIKLGTGGNNEIHDLTPHVQREVEDSGLRKGAVLVFVGGATAAITTLEFEPGLLKDLPAALEKIAPYRADYEHHKTWGDYNGSAHVRAALLGPSLTVPFNDGRLALGTWQQIVLMDFDTRPRSRSVLLQIMGVR